MAYARRSVGTVAVSATASVSPTFGSATAAGSLLIAQLTIQAYTSPSTNAAPTAPAGWSLAATSNEGLSTPDHAFIYYKPNSSASETAPTFTYPGTFTTISIAAVLTEWTGGATSAPVDQTGFSTSISSPAAVSNAAADVAAGELVVASYQAANSKSATATFSDSWTPAGGTASNSGGTGTTKTTFWSYFPTYITSANTSVDTDSLSITPSTGLMSSANAAIASFLLPGAPATSHSLVFPSHRLNPALLRR